jgi:hypothetical protein
MGSGATYRFTKFIPPPLSPRSPPQAHQNPRHSINFKVLPWNDFKSILPHTQLRQHFLTPPQVALEFFGSSRISGEIVKAVNFSQDKS